jgi:hypothetical protein
MLSVSNCLGDTGGTITNEDIILEDIGQRPSSPMTAVISG